MRPISTTARIESQSFEGEPVIEVNGHWDQGAVEDFIRIFRDCLDRVDKRLYLRLEGIDFLDSSALSVILFNMRELAKRGAKLVLLQPSPEMRELLHVVTLDRVLEIRD